jgi:hypothetical protein
MKMKCVFALVVLSLATVLSQTSRAAETFEGLLGEFSQSSAPGLDDFDGIYTGYCVFRNGTVSQDLREMLVVSRGYHGDQKVRVLAFRASSPIQKLDAAGESEVRETIQKEVEAGIVHSAAEVTSWGVTTRRSKYLSFAQIEAEFDLYSVKRTGNDLLMAWRHGELPDLSEVTGAVCRFHNLAYSY